MPGPDGVTNHSDGIASLWVTAWIVLLVVGVITWVLVLWAAFRFRRRRGETGAPPQMRYNMPIEIFYTIVPLILVVGFFAFTAKEQTAIEKKFPEKDVDVHLEVYGKQWAWDFNYLPSDNSSYKSGAYYAGVQATEIESHTDAKGNVDKKDLPTLYLPVGAKVQIDLKSRDVIHSFWVVDFLYKKDTIPGRTNYMSFIPEKEGTYMGKCAELCGEYHSLMLFQVKVVSKDEYNDYVQSLKDSGHAGRLGDDLNRNQNLPGKSTGNEGDQEGSEG